MVVWPIRIGVLLMWSDLLWSVAASAVAAARLTRIMASIILGPFI